MRFIKICLVDQIYIFNLIKKEIIIVRAQCFMGYAVSNFGTNWTLNSPQSNLSILMSQSIGGLLCFFLIKN